MPNPKKLKSPEDQLLADRLKGEADAARCAFSEALHAQIMQRVTAASQGQISHSSPGNARFARIEKTWRPGTRVWATLTAALVFAVGGLWFGQISKSPMDEPGFIPPQTRKTPEVGSAEVHLARIEPAHPAETAELIGDTVMLDQTEILDQTAHLVESVLTTQQWAYLEHDAQVLANLLFDQVPREVRSAGDL